jgi:hypothetical protein
MSQEQKKTCIFMRCTYIKNPAQKKSCMKNADDGVGLRGHGKTNNEKEVATHQGTREENK